MSPAAHLAPPPAPDDQEDDEIFPPGRGDETLSTCMVAFAGKDDFLALKSLLPGRLATASPKRQNEFLAGRHCAARALANAGAPGRWPPLGPDGLPEWPHGWVGGISHSSRGAMAAVAPRSACRSLGVDMEPLIAHETAAGMAQLVAAPEEWAALETLEPSRRLTLIFSAKEALFKALFPLARTFQDFDAARVCAVERDRLRLRLTRSWSAEWRAGHELSVRFRFRGEHVFTCAYIR